MPYPISESEYMRGTGRQPAETQPTTPPTVESLPMQMNVPDPAVTTSTSPAEAAYGDGYRRLIDAYNEAIERTRPETEAEKAAREKMERRRRNIAAISDGIAALANVWYVGKGAPSQVMSNATGKVRESIERARKEREADGDRYNWYLSQKATLEDRVRQAAAARRRADQEYALKEAEQKRKDALQPYLIGKAQADQLAAEAKSREAATAADNAQELLDIEKDVKRSTVGRNNAAAGASRASAARSYAAASASRAAAARSYHGIGNDSYEFLGKSYSNIENKRKAIREKASELDIPVYQEMADEMGNKKKVALDIGVVEKQIYDTLRAQEGTPYKGTMTGVGDNKTVTDNKTMPGVTLR